MKGNFGIEYLRTAHRQNYNFRRKKNCEEKSV